MFNELKEAVEEFQKAGDRVIKIATDMQISLGNLALINQQLVGSVPVAKKNIGDSEEKESKPSAGTKPRRKKRRSFISKAQKLEACKLYETGRYTHKQIAKSFGCSQPTLEKAWADCRKGKLRENTNDEDTGTEQDYAPF